MGALYEDVENFFGDIFAWYGRLVARFPLVFTLVPLFTCIILGLGLINIRYETNIENLYSPINSDAQKDRELLRSFFDLQQIQHQQQNQHHNVTTAHTSQENIHHQTQDFQKKGDFRFHQQINYPAYIEVIVFNKRKQNISSSPTASLSEKCFNLTYLNTVSVSEDWKNNECALVTFDREDQSYPDISTSETNIDELFQNLTEFTEEAKAAIQVLYHSIVTQKGPKNLHTNYTNVCAKLGDTCAVDLYEVSYGVSRDKPSCTYPKSFQEAKKNLSSLGKGGKGVGKKLTTAKPRKTSTASITSAAFSSYKYSQEELIVFNRTLLYDISIYVQTSSNIGNSALLPILQISPSAKAVKLRFNLRGETHGPGRQRHLRWQDATLDFLKKFRSSFIDIAFVASDSLEIELRDHVGGDTKYFALSVVAMLISATLAGNGGSLDHVVLAYTGVVAALLAILGAFGLLSLAGASFVNLCSVMPFLVLGIGVDDMLQLLVGWRKTQSQEERLSGTLRSAAVSITITSLTDLLAFCIGATSPFLSVRNFCACSGLGIFLCYVNQLTFFSGCIVLISNQCKRKRNSRKGHCMTGLPNSLPDKKPATDSTTTTTTIVDCETAADTNQEKPQHFETESTSSKAGHSENDNLSDSTGAAAGDGSDSARALQAKTACCPSIEGKTPPAHRNASSMFTTLVTNVLTSVPASDHRSSEEISFNEGSDAIESKEIEPDICQLVTHCCRLNSCFERRLHKEKHNSRKHLTSLTREIGVCETLSILFSKFYPKVLLHWVGKTTTVVLFLAYVAFSINGVAKLEEGLNLEALVPPEHYYRHHAEVDAKFFLNCGIVVTFVIYQPITYHENHTQERLQSFLKSVEASEFVVNGSRVSWLDAYLGYLAHNDKDRHRKKSAAEFGRKLQKDFLPRHPQYIGDVSFSRYDKSPWLIEASRFYAVCHRTNSSEWEKDLMLAMRKLANNSSLPMKAFSPHFVFYEHYASIVKNALLPVGVTIIGMLFVALVFIPHPIAVTCVVGSMASVVVGMMGFMQLCGLDLSAITTMQIILGVGICVSFTVRTSHAFMTATGKSRNERVTAALVKVGYSILTGAGCSMLSASALYYGSSFIFASFFKTMAFALFLGVLHSIVFLPVMLSFVGPRRTGKPRLFIPVTPATPQAQGSPCRPLIDRERRSSDESNKSKSSTSSITKTSNEAAKTFLNKNLQRSISNDPDHLPEQFDDGSTRGGKPQRVSFKLEETKMKNLSTDPDTKKVDHKQKGRTKATRAQTNL